MSAPAETLFKPSRLEPFRSGPTTAKRRRPLSLRVAATVPQFHRDEGCLEPTLVTRVLQHRPPRVFANFDCESAAWKDTTNNVCEVTTFEVLSFEFSGISNAPTCENYFASAPPAYQLLLRARTWDR